MWNAVKYMVDLTNLRLCRLYWKSCHCINDLDWDIDGSLITGQALYKMVQERGLEIFSLNRPQADSV